MCNTAAKAMPTAKRARTVLHKNDYGPMFREIMRADLNPMQVDGGHDNPVDAEKPLAGEETPPPAGDVTPPLEEIASPEPLGNPPGLHQLEHEMQDDPMGADANPWDGDVDAQVLLANYL